MKKRLGIFCLMLWASASMAGAGAIVLEHSYRSNPDRELEDEKGSLTSHYLVRASVRGGVYSWPASVRLLTSLSSGPNLVHIFHRWELSVKETVTGGALPGDGLNPGAPITGQALCLIERPLFGAGAVDNLCTHRGVSQFPKFSEAGQRYTLKAHAEPNFVLTAPANLGGSLQITIGPGGVIGSAGGAVTFSVRDSFFTPPARPQHLNQIGFRSWTPRCKDKEKKWDPTDCKCVCKQGEEGADGKCVLGEGCLMPERMIRNGDVCSCRPEYPIPVMVGGRLFGCLTELEQIQSHHGIPGGEKIGNRPEGNNEFTLQVCVWQETPSFPPGSGDPPISIDAGSVRCTIVRCSGSGTCYPQQLQAGGGNQKARMGDERYGCFDSWDPAGWHPCDDDPRPWEPIDYVYMDLRSELMTCNRPNPPPWCDEINPGDPDGGDGSGDGVSEGGGESSPADLQVEGLSLLPNAAMAGDTYELEIRLGNAGGESVPTTLYRVQLEKPDGQIESRDRYTGSFAPQTSRLLSVRGEELGHPELSAGEYRLTVWVDPNDEVPEPFEGNNVADTVFTVAPASAGQGQDLRISALRSVDANPASGEALDLEVTVASSGSQATPATTLSLLVTDTHGNGYGDSLQVPALAAGEEITLGFLTGATEPGLHTVTAQVDPERNIAELDEDNNLVMRDVTVFDSSLECLPCTSGTPNHLGALICQDGNGSTSPYPGLQHICRGTRSDGTSCANDPNNPNGWEYVGPQCADPQVLGPGWHANACGEPDVCPGSDQV
ncbi:MAG: hypothetical protein MI919_25010 [Holophagales bacterium]|nr:hypothetical protein [Holophagales bacterium]